MKFIDSHCHIHLPEFDQDRDAVVQRAHAAGVETMVVVGNDHESNLQLVPFVEKTDRCFMTLGIHPHYVQDWTKEVIAWFDDHVMHNKLIAIGETGLDYFRNEHSPLLQEKVLRGQIELAIKANKPVVLHVRDAFADMERILRDYKGLRFIVHCFTGKTDDVSWIVEKGGYISLSGIVTFANAKELQETAKTIPEDHLLIETDAPFLAPHNKRGQRCEPSFVVETAQKIAELRGVQLEELAEKVYQNTRKVFGF